MRGPVREGEAFICRYSWIPHQVRNDETAGSSGVSPQRASAAAGISRPGISGYRVAPGHPAPRCGVHWRESAKGKCRCRYSPPGYSWIPHQVRNDVVTGSRKGPLVGIAFAGISGFRIKCGLTGRVFLDTASSTGSPRTTMRGPERKGEAFICRYSWIPHQVRNDREGISGYRVEHRVTPHPMRGPFAGIPGYRVVARYDQTSASSAI